MTALVGIDPGATGAIAAVQADDPGVLIDVWDMPYLDGHVTAPTVASLLRDLDVAEVWIERAQAYPGQGRSSAFRYGAGWGTLLGVVGALHLPVRHISPAVWKKAAGLSKDKTAARRRACELWPAEADRFARVKDDGRAEAALVARHGALTHTTEGATP